MTNMLNAAVELAEAGWEVLPLVGKIPTTKHGVDDATNNLDEIRAQWTLKPGANIGARVPRDLVVIDVDPRNGGADSLVELVDMLGALPPTLTALSGRGDGGHHRYFLRPTGALKGKAAAGIDVKLNGYMVMPPSIHPATGNPYQWIDRAPVPLPPAWVAYLRVARAKPRTVPTVPTDGDGGGLVRWVSALTPGNRNTGLFWAACRAAETGLLDKVAPDLIGAAVNTGITEREAVATLRSARRTAA